ncbi:unnamed protein product [Orchesella dallaii]|uniref:Uncharacterized protein n=1 Tax=Orchesella dallaii TaxID=48710 RepID=A0ABP1QTM9_9HEXA
MPRFKTSNWSVFVHTGITILISSLFLKMAHSQDWPVVIDPFPDQIGPEPPATPPPTADCTFACQPKIDEALAQIEALQRQLTNANSSLLARILTLEASNNNGVAQRVANLEYYLPSNISMLNTKIDNDVYALRASLSDDIATLRRELELKINSIPSTGGGDGGAKATEVYFNLTSRINNLESGKIQMLITDNNLWRSNFRVVNATFAKLRKSNNGNNVVLTG